MGQVISIERSRNFGVKHAPYAGFTMNSTLSDILVLINLPLGDAGQTERVLAQVIAVNTSTGKNLTLLLDDSQPERLTRTLLGTTEIPGAYEPQFIGSIQQFFADNESRQQAVLLAGGAAHGDLTIARAIHAMASATAEQALEQSLSTSQRVRKLQERLNEGAAQLKTLAA